MKITRAAYFALGALALSVSCSKETAEPDIYDWMDGKIYFRPTLSQVAASRAQDMTLDRLNSFQVTCFNTAAATKNSEGFLEPYFADITFIRKPGTAAGMAYVSKPGEVAYDWPSGTDLLRFFAFSPSTDEMAEGNSALEAEGIDRDSYFNLANRTVEGEAGMDVRYSLGTMRVNPDISRQFDFVTASASGTRLRDFVGGVDLAFSHQLCQVEVRAWGGSEVFDFDIAGVRIGNPVVEGDFIFADDDDPASAPGWAAEDEPVTDKVEYLYRPAESPAADEGRDLPDTAMEPLPCDTLFSINTASHRTQDAAASIMGQGGCAMVIPTENTAWEGLADPATAEPGYSTGRMYFSILLRVTDSSTGTQVYPYPSNPQGMKVVSYAVAPDGALLQRLYAGEKPGEYFTDKELTQPYTLPEDIRTLDFGWAAVPVDADWKAGRKYVYTLDYSEGIGLHDPDDPEPGKPIQGQSAISWGVTVSEWSPAEPGGNYDPDINVPK